MVIVVVAFSTMISLGESLGVLYCNFFSPKEGPEAKTYCEAPPKAYCIEAHTSPARRARYIVRTFGLIDVDD